MTVALKLMHERKDIAMSKYIVTDNKGNDHVLEANSDVEALEIMRTRYSSYIYSVLSADSIVVYRPNGYILAYIDTATGAQTVKQMSDWVKTDDNNG